MWFSSLGGGANSAPSDLLAGLEGHFEADEKGKGNEGRRK